MSRRNGLEMTAEEAAAAAPAPRSYGEIVTSEAGNQKCRNNGVPAAFAKARKLKRLRLAGYREENLHGRAHLRHTTAAPHIVDICPEAVTSTKKTVIAAVSNL